MNHMHMPQLFNGGTSTETRGVTMVTIQREVSATENMFRSTSLSKSFVNSLIGAS